MGRLSLSIVLCIIAMAQSRSIDRRIERRSDSIVSVYDRNCFFSPMGCHFLQGRRAMTFITPKELKHRLHLTSQRHLEEGKKQLHAQI